MDIPLTHAVMPLSRGTGIRAYPDPDTDVLYIESTSALDGGFYDETGRLVTRWHAVEGITTLNVAHFRKAAKRCAQRAPRCPSK